MRLLAIPISEQGDSCTVKKGGFRCPFKKTCVRPHCGACKVEGEMDDTLFSVVSSGEGAEKCFRVGQGGA